MSAGATPTASPGASASGLFGVGISGPALTDDERRILAARPPRAVILFRRNLETIEGIRKLTAEISSLPGHPWLCVDQEGGPVDRFRDLLGSSISFADAARTGVAQGAGELAGAACRLLGFDVDLAPVVDRRLPETSERYLAGRCASADPERVITAASEFLHGLHAAGVSGCVKHFPGLGRASADTHRSLPTLDEDPDQEALDLAPFAGTMDLAGAVMISHAAGPDGVPASLSAARSTDLLRGTLGFPGAAFSDDLEMGALSAFGDLPERCVRAAAAGCDLLFVCSQIDEYDACVSAVEQMVPPGRRAEAAARLDGYGSSVAARRTRRGEAGEVASLERLREEITRLRETVVAPVDGREHPLT
jgi:beta-N-acetylhexosaminidase